MTLDLGHLREYLYLASGGIVPKLRIAKEWLATFQSLLIFFGTIWRFYTNEGRSSRDGRGGYRAPGCCTVIMAWGSFFISCGFFVVICWGLLVDLPDAETRLEASFPAHMNADIYCLYLLTLIWVGYPLVAMASRLGHWGLPGDYYSASWSVFKDIAFAGLDITSKAGLAIFFVIKASWVDAATENRLVLEGEAHLNFTALSISHIG